MTSSMTAFARTEEQTDWGNLIWEIRSVNHRYLESQFRLPENLRDIEPAIREKLRNSVSRGKIESSLFFKALPNQATEFSLNTPLLKELGGALKQIEIQHEGLQNPSALELLRWPGVLEVAELPYDNLKNIALKLYQSALEQLIKMRSQEGEALHRIVTDRLQKVATATASLNERLPSLIGNHKQKFLDRIAAAELDFDSQRLEQEVVLILQKADVSEELDRLQTHVGEVQRAFDQPSAKGRRLDFLMQELNREANTLSSKAIHPDITQVAVELKVLIEQMREQVQNIE